ncbi:MULTISPECIES: PilZ domain-containing protein [Piscirickettsiaceae]|jgi:hypothetical protein|uniref:PilZ domain-containing protein n=1 Tax=Hydrogenovibrio thermophilus TaxID=265883 RepID=A0A451G513_9GAMM|nr:MULTISPECIES: PilZ domain-containing protein [Piscirickettsiaceae]QAB14583.1 PilZ domain-containing protein [Hydrogenovibrio thermophilus]
MLYTAEQRRAERISTERPVKLTTESGSSDAKMLDLSILGVGILSNEELNEGDKVSVQFQLPSIGRSEIKLEGVTAHSTHIRGQQYLIGVEFTDISDYMQSVITEYINYHHRLD